MEAAQTHRTIVFSIFLTHMRRLGVLRTAIGGGLMYLSIVEFMFIHLTGVLVFYKAALGLTGSPKAFRVKDYIIFDRHLIDGMNFFDAFNCWFCAYANGTTKLWNDMLDEMATMTLPDSIIRRVGLLTLALPIVVILMVNYVFSRILFTIIALFLGYHITSGRQADEALKEQGFGRSMPGTFGALLYFSKKYAFILMRNLSQIESSWCPMKHVTTGTTVLPAHHEHFLDRDGLSKFKQIILEKGTVLPLGMKKPKIRF